MNLVSIIIPTYNNPNDLKRAVNSVLNQSYKNFELLIVDDGSTVSYDDFLCFLNKINLNNIHYYKKVNEGPGLARQFGLNLSKGKYIQYLDSDDELLPSKLEIQVKVLENNPDLVMTYGLSMLNSNKTLIHRKKNIKKEEDNLLSSVLEVRKWHTSSCLWRYDKDIYWSNLFNGEDVLHDFIVGLKKGNKIKFINEIVTNIHFDDSLTHLSNVSSDVSKRDRMVFDGLKLVKTMYYLLIENDLLREKNYTEPLSERMFHTACKFLIYGYKKEGNELLDLSKKLTKSFIKKSEIVLVKNIDKIQIKNKRKLFQHYYDFHRFINNKKVHQYRYL